MKPSETDQIIHKALCDLVAKPKTHGICYMVHSRIANIHGYDETYFCCKRRLSALMQAWPKYSGNKTYPIPGPNGVEPEKAYANIPNRLFWSTNHVYGALRLELFEYLLMETGKK
ncbi:hypothetical protein [Pseudomonas phage Astolliot]|nr:hypothetical protein [Pseudomonas phage Astolliot]